MLIKVKSLMRCCVFATFHQGVKIQAKIEWLLNFASAVLMGLFMFFISAEVFSRRFANYPLPGHFDSVELGMGLIVFAGIAYVQASYGHVRMEIIIRKIKGRKRLIVELLCLLLSLFIIIIVAYSGWQVAMCSFHSGDKTIDSEFPYGPSKVLMPIGLIFVALRLFIQILALTHVIARPRAKPLIPLEEGIPLE